MKTITMNYDEYLKELEEAKTEAREEGARQGAAFLTDYLHLYLCSDIPIPFWEECDCLFKGEDREMLVQKVKEILELRK